MQTERITTLMQSLNPQQQEAVSTVEGPIAVVAGAGSGKTRVITYRIPFLLLSGSASSENILALTFTNKAANEMKIRTQQLAGSELTPPLVSTFHSFGALMLRRYINVLGYDRSFMVYDEDDQLSVVKECIRQLNLSEQRYEARDIQYFIKWYKSKLEIPNVYDLNMQKIIECYQRMLRESNAVDFDDLLVLPLQILKEFPQIRQWYLQTYTHLMVDEYQDTNEIQYDLLKTLAGPQSNVLVVGDEDQSIYRFRGACAENIQHFLRDFPNARLIKLEQNYRSTKTILKAAQAVISNNRSRIKKELWTENQPGEPVEVYHAFDEYDEATYVTLRVMAELKEKRPSEIAVLYRANAQSRALEESFVKAQIPHRIVGGVGFYERREIRDVIAFLRLLVNRNDSTSFLRIVNVPPRGVGKKMLEQIQAAASESGSALFDAAMNVGGSAVRDFLRLYEPSLNQKTASAFLQELLQRIGYPDYLRRDEPLTADDRMENVDEFVAHLRDSELQEGFDLTEFIGNLPLQSRTEASDEAVTLLTVHSAKGLEFDVLFVIGLEEGLFPHIKSLESSEDVEEERRLFYVAMTRARQRLLLSWAQRRGMFGSGMSNQPSRFLDEVPSWFKVHKRSERFQTTTQLAGRDAARPPGKGEIKSDPDAPYKAGSIIRHEKLGRGTVLNVEGAPNDWRLTIRFPEGIKTIMSRYAQITVEKK
ncbi:UvrD-helicase domain-containing protein [bacterium]|nr:UvrD-helicase domain-containing protein [bacterium]